MVLRDLPKGAELTCDYRPSLHNGKLRCRCGTALCGGKI
jgi:SET domain-containing protein